MARALPQYSRCMIALPSPDTFDYKLVAWSLYRVETASGIVVRDE
jgi:hypothetical protein